MNLGGSSNKYPLKPKRLSNTDHSRCIEGIKPIVERRHMSSSEYLCLNKEDPQFTTYPLLSSLPLQRERGSSHSSSELSSLEGVWLVRKGEKVKESEEKRK